MNVENSRAQAARCRRLANAILDERASQALVRLAEEYEQQSEPPEPPQFGVAPAAGMPGA